MSTITKPIYSNLQFFVFMYLLGALCFTTTVEQGYLPFFLKLFFELFFDLYILCCLLSILPNHIRSIFSWFLAVFFYVLAIADLFCYIRLGSTLSPVMLRLVLETNSREATEFFSSYIKPDIFISPIGFVLILMFSHIISFFYFKRTKTKEGGTLTNGIITILLLIGIYAGLKNKRNLLYTWQCETIGQVEQFFASEYYHSRAQYLPIHRLAFSIHALRITRNELNILKHTMETTQIDSCSFSSPNIVLIIGESYNKHHSQLYGYSLKTTPYQASRQQEKELFVFTDAVTPYNITSEVFKNAFSLNDVTKKESWYEKSLFTNIFKKAGYTVTFLSNQFVMKQEENIYDFSGGMFLNNIELSNLQFNNRNSKIHQYDEGLLEDYHTISSSKATDHQLIIFSLIGQHINYEDRFPQRFAKFSTNDYHRTDLSKEQLQVVVDYDNATLYNDYIVNKIIQLFEQEDAIVIYMPDHGDECYDELKTCGRQHCDPVTKDIAKNEYQIPFWIWCSHKYQQLHPDIINKITGSIRRRFYSDDLSHLLLYLGGISCKGYRDEYNIISPLYNNSRKRLLRNTTDYDQSFGNY